MNQLSSTGDEGFAISTVPHFAVPVRQTTYLWGSASLTADASFDHAPTLHIRNARHGNAVSINTTTVQGANTLIATLQPGECLSLEIQKISGITATCASETLVHCILR